MSRTGVGIRVLIDGNQLDDGCFVWAAAGDWGEPWTTERTNLCVTPRPDAYANSAWRASPNGSVNDEWVRTTLSAATTPYLFSAPATEAIAVGDTVTLAIEFRVDSPGATHVFVAPHARTGNVYYTRTVFPVVQGQAQRVVITWVSTAAIAANDFDIAVVGSTSVGNFATLPAGFVLRARKPLIERGITDGAFFDGQMPPEGAYRYAFSGAYNASSSLKQRGTFIPDTSGMVPEGLSADEGLKIVWGRATTVEQPSPSTCTFRVTDTGENLYYQNFRIGSDVRVYADAKISGGATLPAFFDPDFETEVRAVTKNSAVGRDNRHVETGSMSAVMKPLNFGAVYSAQFPPSTLQPAGTNPNAWDNLPHISPGETWRLSVRVWVPDGLSVTVRPVIYTGPYAASATALDPIGVARTPGWNTVTAEVSPGVQLGWMGVQLDASGGLDWRNTPDEWTWATIDQTLEWRDFSDVYLDRVEILAPEGGTNLTILVFGGRITDMGAAWDGSSPALDVTATDFLGDLGNRFVGDEPWLLEPLATRVNRVLTLARAANETPITADIASTYTAVPVSWEDVDHRAASGLLADLANSVDGVLWSATHIVSGPYVKIEDPGLRPALYQLGFENGLIVIEVIDPETLPVDQRPLDLSACDVLRDPVEFVLDVADIATRATVGWKEQTVDDEGLPSPTDRTVAVIDSTRETAYGTRNISTQTVLTTLDAATTVAERLLARQTGQWRMSGLRVADEDFNVPDATAVTILSTLLDGVRRGGLAVRVVDLPAWSPIGSSAPAYVEGGEYTYTGGGWVLSLVISRGTGLGRNAQWDEIPPEWQWDQWSPDVTWDDLRGVAAPPD